MQHLEPLGAISVVNVHPSWRAGGSAVSPGLGPVRHFANFAHWDFSELGSFHEPCVLVDLALVDGRVNLGLRVAKSRVHKLLQDPFPPTTSLLYIACIKPDQHREVPTGIFRCPAPDVTKKLGEPIEIAAHSCILRPDHWIEKFSGLGLNPPPPTPAT